MNNPSPDHHGLDMQIWSFDDGESWGGVHYLADLEATCTLQADGPNFRLDIASDDDPLRRRLRKLLERALDATRPIKTSPQAPTVLA